MQVPVGAGHEDHGADQVAQPGREPQPLEPADAIASSLLDPVLAELEPGPDTPLLVLLSGLGGTPSLELHVLFEHLGRQLEDRGLNVARVLVGDLITSLGQRGAVLSIVALDDELVRLWDAPVRTSALHASPHPRTSIVCWTMRPCIPGGCTRWPRRSSPC